MAGSWGARPGTLGEGLPWRVPRTPVGEGQRWPEEQELPGQGRPGQEEFGGEPSQAGPVAVWEVTKLGRGTWTHIIMSIVKPNGVICQSVLNPGLRHSIILCGPKGITNDYEGLTGLHFEQFQCLRDTVAVVLSQMFEIKYV